MRGAGLFDDGWYRTAYPDIPEDEDPLWHFATRGAAAGRDPNPLFDTTWYLTTYHDVRRSGVNPLVHYLNAAPVPDHWPHPSPGLEDGGITYRIDGRPSFKVDVQSVHRPGDDYGAPLAMTALHAINAIPAVTAAAPGHITPLDLPHYTAHGAIH